MRTETTRTAARAFPGLHFLAVAMLLVATAGCRQDMHDQAKYEPLEGSAFYANGMASRPLIANTVPRGFLKEDSVLFSGLDASGKAVGAYPLAQIKERMPGGDAMSDQELRGALLRRGELRYTMFCTPCHGRLGDGGGMIVRRGFQEPPSFHEERLRSSPPGYFVNVMTEGFGQMSSYAAQISPEDRWAVAAYLQALQLSQHARLAELPATVAQSFEQALEGAHGGEAGHDSDRHDPEELDEPSAHGADHSGET